MTTHQMHKSNPFEQLPLATNAPRPKYLLSTLLGFCVGFMVTVGLVVWQRGRADGLLALPYALAIFIPALIGLIAVGLWQLRSRDRPVHWVVAIVALTAGIVGGGLMHMVCPTRQKLADRMLAENIDLFRAKANQFAEFGEIIRAFPAGKSADLITAEQLNSLKTIPMNFSSFHGNAILAVDSDFSRLAADTDPETIMDYVDVPHSDFKPADRHRYGFGGSRTSRVDDLAQIAFGNSSLDFYDVIEAVEFLEELEYIVVVRALEHNPPQLNDKKFLWGYWSGEAYCFDVRANKLLAAFSFMTTNSKEVDFHYYEDSDEEYKELRAVNSLNENLLYNAEPAFWHRFHELAGNATSDHQFGVLPYSSDDLDDAINVLIHQRLDIDQIEELESRAGLAEPGLQKTGISVGTK